MTIEAKNVKPKKQKMVSSATVNGLTEPDRIAVKCRPDSRPKEVKKPRIINSRRYLGKKYAPGDGFCGFDLSHYQGKVNWDQLVNDPHCGYIYLKASEGALLTDDTYKYNLDEAHRVGLKVGSYHFFRATATAQEQFKNFMSIVERKQQDLLPMIDVEVVGKGVNMQKFYSRLEELLQMVEKEFGKKPIIYTGKNFYDRYMSGGRFAGYKFMIAAYCDEQPELNDGTDYLIWQYTGHGRAQGIRGHVDISQFVGGHTLDEIVY